MKSDTKDESEDLIELPHDLITQNILIRLPIKSLLRFKSISKQWYSTISSPHFGHGHGHSKFPHPSSTESLLVRSNNKFQFLSYKNNNKKIVNIDVDFNAPNENLVLVGSCNGLVCLGSTSGCLFIIWNPITREFRKYSDSEISDFSTKACMVTWGFGYVSEIHDYKIVRICKKVMNSSIRVHVFSIKLDKWKRIDEESSHNFSDLITCERLLRPAMFSKERLYWMDGVPPMLAGLERKILFFDLANGKFDTFSDLGVSTPSAGGWLTGNDESFDEFLCVVNGCLAKYGRFARSGEGVITMLKGVDETDRVVVSRDVLGAACKNLVGFRGSEKFFAHYYANHMPNLGVFDLSSRPMKHTPVMTLEKVYKVEIVSYFASLISPVAFMN